MSAEMFAVQFLDNNDEGLTAIMESMASKRTRPPMTVEELIARMEGRFPMYLARWRALV